MATRTGIRRYDAVDADARSAAVLILFGELDSIPSNYDAKAPAVSRELDVLLLARALTLRSHPGQIAFPGGRIDHARVAVEAQRDEILRMGRRDTGSDCITVPPCRAVAEANELRERVAVLEGQLAMRGTP